MEQHHLEELNDTIKHVSAIQENFDPQKNIDEFFFYIDDFDREIRTYDTLKKRQNIETRGYDTNATITRKAYQQEELALEQENAVEEENPQSSRTSTPTFRNTRTTSLNPKPTTLPVGATSRSRPSHPTPLVGQTNEKRPLW